DTACGGQCRHHRLPRAGFPAPEGQNRDDTGYVQPWSRSPGGGKRSYKLLPRSPRCPEGRLRTAGPHGGNTGRIRRCLDFFAGVAGGGRENREYGETIARDIRAEGNCGNPVRPTSTGNNGKPVA